MPLWGEEAAALTELPNSEAGTEAEQEAAEARYDVIENRLLTIEDALVSAFYKYSMGYASYGSGGASR